MQTARGLVAQWWSEAWDEGLWAASWSASVDGLTPEQAAWTPGRGRHSIWQIVLHMCFWREMYLRKVRGGAGPSEAERSADNFPEIGDVTGEGWAAARSRLEASQRNVAAAFADESLDVSGLGYALAHDCYHMGQINLLRAMQGLVAIE